MFGGWNGKTGHTFRYYRKKLKQLLDRELE